MSKTEGMKFSRIRAGWYETGNEVEGAYVISSDEPGSWIVSRWTMIRDFGSNSLELSNIESAGTLAYAKELAEFDARLDQVRS
jgi:hypothetical protein